MSNYNGGTLEAKKQFLKDVQNDADFIEHKKNSIQQIFKQNSRETKMWITFGTVSVREDSYVTDAQITKIIKEWQTKTTI